MRVISLPPETVQMNRVLREYVAPKFRQAIEDERLKTFLLEGFRIGGKTYELLGCSNSQLRQHVCWMYAKERDSGITVEDFRHGMGDVANIRYVWLCTFLDLDSSRRPLMAWT
ncbi:hypothetical protein LSH36_2154g00000 [Paralvinella palmiformis]|uniref:RNA-dependent RNA polymerase n=1 Tax=Paralvinella palmiformis TaxID=53620 RepID=A0AAD9IRM4_9ANNE|nr:hypothetical protein LSH36_2154g00000 [Paralvinella palmiformis]